MRPAVALLLVAAGCLTGGCGGPESGARELKSVGATPPAPSDRADAIELYASPPAAINWDEVPGPDGLQARLLLFRVDRPEPVMVKGTLEFVIHAGRVPKSGVSQAKPLRVWTFKGEQLDPYRMRNVFGWGYAVQLGWGRDVPDASVITLSARYVSPDGRVVYSAPISIAVPQATSTGPVKTSLGDPEARTRASLVRDGGLALTRPLKFRHETIDADPPGAQHAITLLADLTGDGRPEIIIGCKRGTHNLFWYENPSWKRHNMAAAPGLAGAVVADVNGDGRPDVVAGQETGDQELYWFECPTDPTQAWSRHVIASAAGRSCNLAVGDVDGDGKQEIVVLAQKAGVLVAYDVPEDPRVEPWPEACRHEVATGIEDAAGLVVVDLDGDGQPEIVAGTIIYKRLPQDGGWQGEPFVARYAPTAMAAIDLDGDSRLEIVACEGGSQAGRLVWFKAPAWTPHPLREGLFHPRSLQIADFNGDGRPDILVAEMGLGRNQRPRMWVYENRGRGRFQETVVSEGVPTHEAKVGDLNGDRRPDVVGKPYEPERHVDVWFNET